MKRLKQFLALLGVGLLTLASLTACGNLTAYATCTPTIKDGKPAVTYTYHFEADPDATVSLALRSPGAQNDELDQPLGIIMEGMTEGALPFTWSNPAPGYKLVLRAAGPGNNQNSASEKLAIPCPENLTQ